MRLPEGSQARTCEPPGPVTTSLRNGTPSARRRATSAATLAHELGLGVNAGHDLDLKNLSLFKTLPHLDEVSIGHALIGDALELGMAETIRRYLAACAAAG